MSIHDFGANQCNQGANENEDNILWDIGFRGMAGTILQLSGLSAGQKARGKKYTVQESGPDRYVTADRFSSGHRISCAAFGLKIAAGPNTFDHSQPSRSFFSL